MYPFPRSFVLERQQMKNDQQSDEAVIIRQCLEGDAPTSTYTGTTIGITAGYDIAETLLLTPGYSYTVQNYNNVGSKLITNTASLGPEKRPAKAWSVGGEYDMQISKLDNGSSTTDNIFSLALRYSAGNAGP